jgi:hypothetical protein
VDIVRQVLAFARGLEGERIEVQPKHLLKDLENIIKDKRQMPQLGARPDPP